MTERVGQLVVRAFEVLIVVCLAVMGILVFGNVILRYAFNSGIAVSEELSRLLFVWLIFLGSVLASAQRIHIGFDTLLHRVGPRWRRALVTFNASLILVGCVIFIVGGWSQVQVNLANSYPVLGISYAWLYAVALVFGVALIFPVCNNILSVFRGDREPLTLDLGQRIEGQIGRIEERQTAAHPPSGERPQ
ncbi:MAG: TRAP transporter small permease [Burkholderiales bacterium]|nr:TRAP transporter small permease [Burkholderiales bacterium]